MGERGNSFNRWLDRCAGTIFFGLALHLATVGR